MVAAPRDGTTHAGDLAELEQQIERSLGTESFYAAGVALRAIRDQHLYKATHPRFDAYVRARWEMKARTAYQLIAAAGVVDTLRNCAYDLMPSNEAQARPLTSKRLTAEQVCEVWGIVLETAPDGQLTARHVKETVAAYLGGADPERAEKKQPGEPDAKPDRRVEALRKAASMVWDLHQALNPSLPEMGWGRSVHVRQDTEGNWVESEPDSPLAVDTADAASWVSWWRRELTRIQAAVGPWFGYAQHQYEIDPDGLSLRLQIDDDSSVLIELRASLNPERAGWHARPDDPIAIEEARRFAERIAQLSAEPVRGRGVAGNSDHQQRWAKVKAISSRMQEDPDYKREVYTRLLGAEWAEGATSPTNGHRGGRRKSAQLRSAGGDR